MAIAHSNLQNYDEAARCYLQTLSLNPDAVHIWSYLRITLTCSEKWDLLPLTIRPSVSRACARMSTRPPFYKTHFEHEFMDTTSSLIY